MINKININNVVGRIQMRELRGPALRWRNISENINYKMKQNRIIFRFNSSVPTQGSLLFNT